MQLTDRELADIGISRSEIERVSRKRPQIGDPMTSAYEQGRKAAQRGKHIQACPFDTGTVEWHGWRQGFCDAHKTKSCSPNGTEESAP
jgi:ribosome modulation factor